MFPYISLIKSIFFFDSIFFPPFGDFCRLEKMVEGRGSPHRKWTFFAKMTNFFDFSLTRARLSPNQLPAQHQFLHHCSLAGRRRIEHAQHQIISDR